MELHIKSNYKLKFPRFERRLGYVSSETRDWLVLGRENSLVTNQKEFTDLCYFEAGLNAGKMEPLKNMFLYSDRLNKYADIADAVDDEGTVHCRRL